MVVTGHSHGQFLDQRRLSSRPDTWEHRKAIYLNREDQLGISLAQARRRHLFPAPRYYHPAGVHAALGNEMLRSKTAEDFDDDLQWLNGGTGLTGRAIA